MLEPSPADEAPSALKPENHQPPHRSLSRSPHPYHHQTAERCVLGPGDPPRLAKDSSPASESGTDADDEHFLKGLPAPRVKLHKGLRGHNEFPSRPSTPLPCPAFPRDELPPPVVEQGLPELRPSLAGRLRESALRKKKVLVRRATELCLVASLARIVRSNARVSLLLSVWRRDFQLLALLFAALLALYPIRVVGWAYRRHRPSRPFPFEMPSSFDPAPLLYPPAITVFASLLISVRNPAVLLPNIMLSISALPRSLVPTVEFAAALDIPHWLLSCLPLLRDSITTQLSQQELAGETLVLLHPLHQTLCSVLQHLTTTSLLEAELQLLSVALINILILAVSPQMQVLKALLWVGGLSAIVFCGPVISNGISLARVPKWRFRRELDPPKDANRLVSWRRAKKGLLGLMRGDESNPPSSEDDKSPSRFVGFSRVRTIGPSARRDRAASDDRPRSPNTVTRRHTMPRSDKMTQQSLNRTSFGRRRRATSGSVRPFLRLTQAEATRRKWLYALYIYACLLAIIFVGIRAHVQRYALDGLEPIGWGLGYVLGDWPWFRFHVVQAELERWICLNDGLEDGRGQDDGWAQRLRLVWGAANTRLLLSGYWLLILVVGLMIVFRLKERYEVDTRRKVFHFMMVAMFLPGTYVDPAFAALALALVLAIFLILDLLRASQLPPLSKPIASFLAPYVDGRDFRGSVVVSHMFLLIGCAIPLWLALATVPRSGTARGAGWEVPTRDVSMVSGVVCVGLGDAAASLIGRRYGRRKWLWGGGKSLEGSAAFAIAVVAGLVVARCWLRAGGWPTEEGYDEAVGSLAGVRNAAVCASVASMTEAVLTGGNDNVIVPVILWTCVKSLGV
ncbi:hypothetical protein L249_2017 [Ophiocordyceps polyrhachis-furcata BCC 54312]|uniref:dolichol kinase n=1 Tax=Ophiocordyceps polyrhachis-furcata BCC 54312 TaxID=1330021 RepID=A0A367LNA2_9HYPO|nr:hypothetical protein L249_2017 [Ophiocordyceps polyrhachis-furcata BCC 54312]